MDRNQPLKIGIIREGKIPPDSRVVLTPEQCAKIQAEFNIEILIQSSKTRCFDDGTYSQKDIKVVNNIDQCDILIGVKEVPIPDLIANKTYFFFSHTIKAQSYNRKLLQSILSRNIRLIDYEVLTNENGQRVIAFGKFAGMVGAHNALYAYGKRTGLFNLDRMFTFDLYKDAVNQYESILFPPVKVVVTGLGRVANGACDVLSDMGFKRKNPSAFLDHDYEIPVFTQLDVVDYAKSKDGIPFTQNEYFQKPELFESNFQPYYKQADIFINGIFWDPQAPAFFGLNEMKSSDFKVQIIADITCDIAPEASIPSTIRPSTIKDPIYGFDPQNEIENPPFQKNSIDVMAVDNLPNELPKDASKAFGEQFIEDVLPNLLEGFNNPMIKRATIATNGELGPNFKYLSKFVNTES